MQGAVAMAEPAYAAQRRAMVDGQIRTFDVTDHGIVQAFLAVPRESFLPPDLRSLAYSDAVLTVKGRTSRVMLQPMHLARLIQGAAVQPDDKVLVVAGGTGYAACVLAHLAASVVTLEADADFTATATEVAAELGLTHVVAITGDLAAGCASQGPYDVIVVPGGVETNLDALFDQLAPAGRLVAIEFKAGETSRRAGKAIRFQRFARDNSERPLFEATAPVIAEFRAAGKFVF